MTLAAGPGALFRFLAGTAASVGIGVALFRTELFRPDAPWFQCIVAGALVAGVVGLFRVGLPEQALSLATAFCLVHFGYAWTQGWSRALAEAAWSVVLGGGTVLSALVFDRLAQGGYRFGKFVLLGPLIAGAFLAATTVSLVGPATGEDALGVLIRYVLVGLVVGDAVGLAIEIVDLAAPPARADVRTTP